MLIIGSVHKYSQKRLLPIIREKRFNNKDSESRIRKGAPILQIFPLEPLKKTQTYLMTFSYLALVTKIQFFNSFKTA